MLARLGERIANGLERVTPWTNVVGLARSVLAGGLLATFLFNPSSMLFVKISGIPEPPICVGPSKGGLFCLLGKSHLELGRWLMIAGLILVVSGWRPRYTAILHSFLAWSFHVGASVVDGGDQAHQVLAALLLPISLTDPRRWHWDPMPVMTPGLATDLKKMLAYTTWWLIRIQVSGIYFHAAAGKYATREWADGTATYYWFTHPTFGIPDWQRALIMPILTHESVAALTWGVMILEFLLMAALIASRRVWRYLLVGGLTLHILIGLMQGLVSFGFTMSAALVLYLRPLDEPFAFVWPRKIKARLVTLGASLRPKANEVVTEKG